MMLTLFQPLSAEESSRFEDLSKVYFEDFYAAPYVLRPGAKGPPQPDSRSEQVFEFEDDQSNKRDVRTPTDVRAVSSVWTSNYSLYITSLL